MSFKKATRKQLKLRLALQGPSGSGKSFSAQLIARGVVGPEGKIAVIDTEEGSASLYADRFDFDTCDLRPPFEPEAYIKLIKEAEAAGYDLIIIDSASHEWIGQGGCLEIHDAMPGNSWVNWGPVNKRHSAFLEAILRCKCHVILTLRAKQAYVQAQKNGKQVIEKKGLQSQQRDGFEYELTSVLALESEMACRDKDRTGLFAEGVWFKPTIETGEKLAEWLGEGTDFVGELQAAIKACNSEAELMALFQREKASINAHPAKADIMGCLSARKAEVLPPAEAEEGKAA